MLRALHRLHVYGFPDVEDIASEITEIMMVEPVAGIFVYSDETRGGRMEAVKKAMVREEWEVGWPDNEHRGL